MVDILNGICSSIFLYVIPLICDILKKIVFLKNFQRTDISVEMWILSEMNRLFWSWSRSWLSFGAILPYTYLDIIMSSLNTHLYTQLFRLYGQKTEKGQFFVQISTLLYAFKLSHAREFSSKVLDIQDFVWKDHSHQPEIWMGASDPVGTGTDLLSQILVFFHFHFQLLISALFQTVNFRHSQAFIYTKDVSYENILLIKR